MNVKSKCTIPANHFEYFIMGAKYHYSPPVQFTPSSNRHRVHPSRKARANSSVTVRYERTRMEGDRASRDTQTHPHTRATRRRKRERHLLRAERGWKRNRGVGREDGKGSGRMRAGEEEKRTWKREQRTRADVSIRGTGWHAGHACTYTRVSLYIRATYIRTHTRARSGYERARYGVCDRD